jgi:hypothetical protein
MLTAAAPSPLQLLAATDAIYRAWLPHVGDIEAREQAQVFARRFHILIDGPLCPLPSDERTDYPDDDEVQPARRNGIVMNKRERDEHHNRNFWDNIHAENLMMLIRNGRAGLWTVDLVEAHRHLVWHFAHEENARFDFNRRHKIGQHQQRKEAPCSTTA